MADDNTLRPYRSTDPYRRAAEPARPSEHAAASDPLAELARLIGQTDPFAQLGRGTPHDAPRPNYPPRPAAADWQHAPEPEQHRYSSRDDIYPASTDAEFSDPPAAADYREPPVPASYADPHAGHDPYAQAQRHDPYAQAQRRDPYAQDQRHDPYAQDQRQDPYAQHHDPYAQAQHRGSEPYDLGADAYDQSQGYEAPVHRGVRAPAHQQAHDANYYYDAGAPIDPHEDQMYDDAPGSRRRRGGLVTALALIGCAMVGTAGAYGYRSFYADAGAKGPPPVISADNSTPTKIVPAGAGDPQADSQSNKPISDRFANAGAGKEQIVSRQEEPVALKEPEAAAPPRVVLPSPVTPNGSPQASAPPKVAPPVQPAPAAAAPSAGGSAPKRVRTVVIRPDGSDSTGRPIRSRAVQEAPAAATPPARAAHSASRAAAPPQRHSGNAPLSLDPQGQSAETGSAQPQPRVRSAHNRAAAPEPEQRSAGRSYVVQISSQTSERDAKAAFRSLQAKFPNELGDQQPIIRRVDLGSRGVYYRTNVGPFASVGEAGQFCARYKAAGGQCIVPRN
jgi:SPOR domain